MFQPNRTSLGSIFIVHIIAALLYAGGAAWAIVSFILYLVKDRPFDWPSLWLIGGGVLLGILNFFRVFRR